MNTKLLNFGTSIVGAFVLTVLLGACASSTEKDVLEDYWADSGPSVRCPVGYMMICEAKKVGRIRFGRIGKDNLDLCSCEPEISSSSRIMDVPKIPY